MAVTKEDTEAMVKALNEIHDDIVSATETPIHKMLDGLPRGGERGVRESAGIHLLAYKILTMIDRKPNLPANELGAEILHDMATRHYFWDGNKRTAYVMTKTMMARYGLKLKPDYANAVGFIIKVADGKVNMSGIRKWILENSVSDSK